MEKSDGDQKWARRSIMTPVPAPDWLGYITAWLEIQNIKVLHNSILPATILLEKNQTNAIRYTMNLYWKQKWCIKKANLTRL